MDDLNKLRYYAHAIRAALFGFLVSGTFLSIFGYPHFWLVTAMTVVLKLRLTDRLKEAAESGGKALEM